MATSPVARPQFHLFPDDNTQHFQAAQPLHQPPVHSHYRPFSTLYTDPPYIDLQPPRKPSRLKRASSVGAMQALSHMMPGRDKTSKPNPFSLSNAPKMPAALKFKSRWSPAHDDSEPAPAAMKKKRSMASLFSSAEALVESGNGEPITGQRRSPLGAAYHVSTPPPSASVHKAPPSAHKAVAFKDSTSDPDLQSPFLPKDIWSKRNNMSLHPYHDRVPYMQAYNPILLDKCVLSRIYAAFLADFSIASDYHTDILLRHLSEGRPSFHDFGKKPPATILDLGCGQGHWTLYTASVWKQSQITGVDIVDITLPAFETTDNLFFKQANLCVAW